MSLFKSELSRYASMVESSLQHTIPNTLSEYGSDARKTQVQSFVLQ